MVANGIFANPGYAVAAASALVALIAYVGLPSYALLRALVRHRFGMPSQTRGPVAAKPSLIEIVTSVFGGLACAFVLSLVLSQFAVVMLRYVFSVGYIALQEIVIYFHSLVFMLGAAYTLQRNEHVRVDVIYAKLSVRGRAIVNLTGSCLLLLPFATTVLVTGFNYVARAWQSREASIEISGLPLVFLLKSVIILFALLLVLQALSWSWQAIVLLTRDDVDSD